MIVYRTGSLVGVLLSTGTSRAGEKGVDYRTGSLLVKLVHSTNVQYGQEILSGL